MMLCSAKAQFTGTDSLRNYNNRYITNNPATAFTNLRLNTLIRGVIDWVDTARAGTGGGGALGVDTLWALNDSTVRYRKSGVFRNMILKGVYDTRRKVDTAYALNDSTLQIKINGTNRNIILPGRHWTLQGVLNNGSTLTENETITLADSLTFTSGMVVINNLNLPSLPTAVDTSLVKPTGTDAAGNTYKMAGWPGSGGPGIDSIRQHQDSVNMYTGATGTFQFKNKNTDTADWYNARDWEMRGDGVTDNTGALQALINIIGLRKRNSVIYFPDTVYIFSGDYQDTARMNAQIIFPSVHIDSVQYTITLVGSRRPPFSPTAFESTPAPAGTKFRSTRSGNTQANPCFFGGKGPVGGANDEVSYMVPGFENITFQMPSNPTASCLNFNNFTNRWLSEVNIIAGNSQSVLDKPEPTHSTSFGVIDPHYSSGTDQRIKGYVSVLGFYNGVRVGENANYEYLGVYACKNATVFDQSSGTSLIQKLAVGWCPYTFYFRSAHATGTTVDVREYSVERWTDAAWYTFVADVNDPTNIARGDISYYTNNAVVGTINSRQFTRVGGDSLHIRHIGSTDTHLDMRNAENVRLDNDTNIPGYVQPTLYPYGTPTTNVANSLTVIPKGIGDGTFLAGLAIFGTDFRADQGNFVYSHMDAKASTFDQIITAGGSVGLRPYRIIVGSNDPFTFGTDGSLSASGYTTKSTLRIGAMYHQAYSVNNNWIGDNIDYDNTNFKYKANGYGVMWRNITGGFQIETAPSGSAGGNATMSTRFHVANTGAITFGNSSNSYTFPTTRASAGQVLTDVSGTGTVTWATPSGADGNGIYGGNGSLPSNVTVTGSNNSITWDDIFAFHVKSDYSVLSKANGTGSYTKAVIGAGNQYWIGYTPTAGTYDKGAGIVIDTNENVGIGTSPPTAMPLYATGSSFFVQGLQSNHGNFYKVQNQTADFTASLQAYFYTIDATSGNITVTLPAASTAFGNTMGIVYKFQRTDNSGNTVTIQRAGSDTINGGTSFTLTAQWGVKMLQCTSTSTWAQW